MKAFKLDSKGDLVFHNGDLVMVEGGEELAQSVDRILTTNIGEWFLDEGFGMDYQAVRGKGKEDEGIKATVADAIYQEERIDSVEIQALERKKDRHLAIRGSASDTDGNVIDLGELEVAEI